MIVVLGDYIKYREEYWGCSIINVQTREIKLFNESAYEIIDYCTKSISIKSLIDNLSTRFTINPNGVFKFILQLIDDNVLQTAAKEKVESKAEIFRYKKLGNPTNEFITPVAIEIEYTYKCSRNCTYCAYDANPSVDINKELSNDIWEKILVDLKKSGVGYIRFTGGDPFVRKDFHDILRFADSLNFIISVGTDLSITNDSDYVCLSSLKNLSMVQTTLDGATAKSADRFRGFGNFEKVLRGMRSLASYRIPFILGTVLRKSNVNEIFSIGKIAGNHGASGYCFAPLYSAGRGVNIEHEIPSNDDLATAHLQFKKLINQGIVNPADQFWLDYTNGLSDEEFKIALDNQPYLSRVGDRILRIDPFGKYYVSIKMKQSLGYDAAVIGDSCKESLLHVWSKSQSLELFKNKSFKSPFGNVIDTRTFN